MGDVTADRLKKIEARERAATPGPWVWDRDTNAVDTADSRALVLMDDREGAQGSNDAAFIAHARGDIPYLIARVVAAEARADEAERLQAMEAAATSEVRERLIAAEARAEKLEGALIRCAEIAGEDGEAVEAARSGAMKQPTVEEFAIRAVSQLRADSEEDAALTPVVAADKETR